MSFVEKSSEHVSNDCFFVLSCSLNPDGAGFRIMNLGPEGVYLPEGVYSPRLPRSLPLAGLGPGMDLGRFWVNFGEVASSQVR